MNQVLCKNYAGHLYMCNSYERHITPLAKEELQSFAGLFCTTLYVALLPYFLAYNPFPQNQHVKIGVPIMHEKNGFSRVQQLVAEEQWQH